VNGTVVVKLGGSTLGSHDTSLADIAALYQQRRRVVVVHGGGALVSEWLSARGLEARFLGGLRVTDEASLDVVVAVLCGLVNKRLTASLTALGARALGLSGADGRVVEAYRSRPELGFVGEIIAVNSIVLDQLLRRRFLPVLAPIAVETEEGDPAQLLNTNADTCAGEVAVALSADDLVFLTDVPGVLDAERQPIAELTEDQALTLLQTGAVSGGMIPKIKAAIRAATAGCRTHIVDGRHANALRAALDGRPGGTRIVLRR